MLPVSQLQLARKYPFLPVARTIVKQEIPDLSQVSQSMFSRAMDWIVYAAIRSPKEKHSFIENHFSRKDLTYPDFLIEDIASFPLAKILVSGTRNPKLFDSFSQLVGDTSFEYLVHEKDRLSVLLDLVREMGLRMEIHPSQKETVRIPMSEYLRIPLRDAQLHLVYQSVDRGMVTLPFNLAARWLAESVHHAVLSTLPVNAGKLPAVFNEVNEKLAARLEKVRESETRLSVTGAVSLSAFPPCMEKLHADITNGINIPHMARFDLATFLININMPREEIVNVFSKAANYDERTTRYHVDNLSGKSSGKKYSMPACAKIREHGYCISRTCDVAHPLRFYEREKANESAPKQETPPEVIEKPAE